MTDIDPTTELARYNTGAGESSGIMGPEFQQLTSRWTDPENARLIEDEARDIARDEELNRRPAQHRQSTRRPEEQLP